MVIHGFQKMTMLDFPGRVACTVFTAGCNFRCPFCHNALLVTRTQEGTVISEEEIFSYLEKRRGILDGVCITGGEPLLQKDLESFIRRIRSMGLAVKLDTNGSDPEKLLYLINEGLLDYVAMDIKNCPEKYPETCGLEKMDMDAIRESVRVLMEGRVPYEFRTTVVDGYHDSEAMEKLGAFIRGAQQYYLQAFVDSGDLIGENLTGVGREKLGEFLITVRKYVPNAQIRGI